MFFLGAREKEREERAKGLRKREWPRRQSALRGEKTGGGAVGRGRWLTFPQREEREGALEKREGNVA